MQFPFADNPIVDREWRGLRGQLRDWRIWVGLRLPRHPTAWGFPTVAWFALAPYVAWVVALILRGFDPSILNTTGVDLFAVLLIWFAFSAAAIALTMGAFTFSREREQETWDQLRVTSLTTRELVLGYWWARFSPTAVGLGISVVAWILLWPHYRSLLEPLGPFWLDQKELLLIGVQLLASVAALCALGVYCSAHEDHSRTAIASAATMALLVGLIDFAVYSGNSHALLRQGYMVLRLFLLAGVAERALGGAIRALWNEGIESGSDATLSSPQESPSRQELGARSS